MATDSRPVQSATIPDDMPQLRSFMGLLVLLAICWALSRDRRAISWRIVGWGVALQFLFGAIVLLTPMGGGFFGGINDALLKLMKFSEAGSGFLFGDLIFNTVPVGNGAAGSNAPLTETGTLAARTGAYVAFHVLPTIIFFSALMAVLYHLGIMQRVIKGVAWVMQRTMRTSGAETVATAGTIFVGLVETPLIVRPYLERMTRSEVFALMTATLATISGGVMVAYVGMLSPWFPTIGGHLMSASVMSAPAAFVVAKLMIPETETPETSGTLDISAGNSDDVNVIDAAGRGGVEGAVLALKVGALLIAFLGLLALVNALIGWAGSLLSVEELSLQRIFGWTLSPVAWLLGVPWAEAGTAGQLIGVKTVLNEFIAFRGLADNLAGPDAIGPRATIIVSYALCGFANFGSIAMQTAGMGALAPSKRGLLAQLALKSLVAGTMASLMTAAIAGILVR